MEKLIIPTTKGDIENIIYNVHDFPYERFTHYERVRKNRRCSYIQLACAFDIESTTMPPVSANESPQAFMYHWQFCIHDTVVFGRLWEEFQYFLNELRYRMELTKYNKLVVYVHNLGYEFQFMRNFIQIDSIFAKDKRKPLKVESQGIEFRCSYYLSNMSLAKFCQNSKGCTYYKMVDTYDYKKLRTPETSLTLQEKQYCYLDVRGLCQCIESYFPDDNLATIPITSTGFVRRDFRKAMAENPQNRIDFLASKLSADKYTLLLKCFRGGDTHASRFHANKILENVKSRDRASSYPAVMMTEEFPHGSFTDIKIETRQELDFLLKNNRTAFTIDFFNIRVKPTKAFPYIDIAHCEKFKDIKNDNGRVLSAKFIRYNCVDIDLEIIMKDYEYDIMDIKKAITCDKKKLSNEERNQIMEYFYKKTTLKGIAGKEYEYMKSKNKLNSAFGMAVSKPNHDNIVFDGINWSTVETDVQDGLNKFYNSKNSFLSYQCGVWVTAFARRELRKAIDIVGFDGIYCDTDSVKYTGDYDLEFDKLNNDIINKTVNNDIPGFLNYNGKDYILGVWENDGEYKRFKTLGAKKYCYDAEDGFHITVAGLNKKQGAKSIGCMENFEIGRTYKNVSHNVSWYNDYAEPFEITIDGCKFTTGSNIAIMESDYELGITNEYWDIIKLIQENMY